MTCSAKPLSLVLLPCICLISAGCQRSMNGPLASSPFSPGGVTAQSGGSPLIPLGPVSGATRVPPPATGSSSTSNGYLGVPSASNLGAGGSMQFAGSAAQSGTGAPAFGAPAFGAAGPASGLAANDAVTSADEFRNSLGGMNVIDLTNAPPPPGAYPRGPIAAGNPIAASLPSNASFAAVASSGAAVGSGLTYANPNASDAFVPAQQPADLLRPIDQPFVAAAVPRYRGLDSSNSPQVAQAAHTRPVSETSGSPAAQSDPALAPVTHTASPTLPWRSPTTAR